MEVGLFFVPKTKDKKRFVAVNKETLQRQKRESAGDKRHMEVEVVRVKSHWHAQNVNSVITT